jgi:hypothetical protein
MARPFTIHREQLQLFTDIVVEEVRKASALRDDQVFYVYAVPCPECKRHIIAMLMSVDTKPRRYLVATIWAGTVISRLGRRS